MGFGPVVEGFLQPQSNSLMLIQGEGAIISSPSQSSQVDWTPEFRLQLVIGVATLRSEPSAAAIGCLPGS